MVSVALHMHTLRVPSSCAGLGARRQRGQQETLSWECEPQVCGSCACVAAASFGQGRRGFPGRQQEAGRGPHRHGKRQMAPGGRETLSLLAPVSCTGRHGAQRQEGQACHLGTVLPAAAILQAPNFHQAPTRCRKPGLSSSVPRAISMILLFHTGRN